MVKNMVLASNYEEERKYLQYLMRKHAGKHVTDIAECKDGGQTMNEEYKSVVKEIDEMLAIREIDEFLDKIEKKKKSEKGEVKEKELKQIKKEIQEKEKEERKVESKKSKVLPCKVVICENTKEEIFELPEKPKREIFELYAGPRTEKYKRKIVIN